MADAFCLFVHQPAALDSILHVLLWDSSVKADGAPPSQPDERQSTHQHIFDAYAAAECSMLPLKPLPLPLVENISSSLNLDDSVWELPGTSTQSGLSTRDDCSLDAVMQ